MGDSDDGKTEKKNQATKDEKEERILYAMDLIAQGLERSKAVKKIQEKFNVKIVQSYNYFNFAKQRFTENLSVELLSKWNISNYTRMLIKRMAFEKDDLRLAHDVQIEIDKFLGLDAIGPYLALQSDFIQYFQEELIRILNRNNNIVDKEERLNRTIQDISRATRSIAEKVNLIGSGEDTDQTESEGGETRPGETAEPFSVL